MIKPVISRLSTPRPECCGTCDHLRVVDQLYAYCPLADCLLQGDVTAMTCPAWKQDKHDSYALELFEELTRKTP